MHHIRPVRIAAVVTTCIVVWFSSVALAQTCQLNVEGTIGKMPITAQNDAKAYCLINTTRPRGSPHKKRRCSGYSETPNAKGDLICRKVLAENNTIFLSTDLYVLPEKYTIGPSQLYAECIVTAEGYSFEPVSCNLTTPPSQAKTVTLVPKPYCNVTLLNQMGNDLEISKPVKLQLSNDQQSVTIPVKVVGDNIMRISADDLQRIRTNTFLRYKLITKDSTAFSANYNTTAQQGTFQSSSKSSPKDSENHFDIMGCYSKRQASLKVTLKSLRLRLLQTASATSIIISTLGGTTNATFPVHTQIARGLHVFSSKDLERLLKDLKKDTAQITIKVVNAKQTVFESTPISLDELLEPEAGFYPFDARLPESTHSFLVSDCLKVLEYYNVSDNKESSVTFSRGQVTVTKSLPGLYENKRNHRRYSIFIRYKRRKLSGGETKYSCKLARRYERFARTKRKRFTYILKFCLNEEGDCKPSPIGLTSIEPYTGDNIQHATIKAPSTLQLETKTIIDSVFDEDDAPFRVTSPFFRLKTCAKTKNNTIQCAYRERHPKKGILLRINNSIQGDGVPYKVRSLDTAPKATLLVYGPDIFVTGKVEDGEWRFVIGGTDSKKSDPNPVERLEMMTGQTPRFRLSLPGYLVDPQASTFTIAREQLKAGEVKHDIKIVRDPLYHALKPYIHSTTKREEAVTALNECDWQFNVSLKSAISDLATEYTLVEKNIVMPETKLRRLLAALENVSVDRNALTPQCAIGAYYLAGAAHMVLGKLFSCRGARRGIRHCRERSEGLLNNARLMLNFQLAKDHSNTFPIDKHELEVDALYAKFCHFVYQTARSKRVLRRTRRRVLKKQNQTSADSVRDKATAIESRSRLLITSPELQSKKALVSDVRLIFTAMERWNAVIRSSAPRKPMKQFQRIARDICGN